jgi:Protein of unknown function (DUF1648).
MKKRPIIKLELSITDKIFEVLGWCAMLMTWVLIITNYSKLPNIIPTHYNYAGQADSFGDKEKILILPIVATILFIGMTILNKYPHLFNYPKKITESNALKQYTIATRLIRCLKFAIVLTFGFIVFVSIRDANGLSSGLSALFLPLVIGLITVPLVYFITKLYKTN